MEIGGYLSDWLNVSLNMRWEWIILLLKSSHYAAYADSYFVFSYCVTLYLNLRQMSTDAGLAVCIWNSLCVFQWLAFRSSFKMGLTQDEFSVTVNSCAGRMDCQLWHPISETAYGHKMYSTLDYWRQYCRKSAPKVTDLRGLSAHLQVSTCSDCSVWHSALYRYHMRCVSEGKIWYDHTGIAFCFLVFLRSCLQVGAVEAAVVFWLCCGVVSSMMCCTQLSWPQAHEMAVIWPTQTASSRPWEQSWGA